MYDHGIANNNRIFGWNSHLISKSSTLHYFIGHCCNIVRFILNDTMRFEYNKLKFKIKSSSTTNNTFTFDLMNVFHAF